MVSDPFVLFDTWHAEARESEINDSNAMALATVDSVGRPSVRMVLLKGHGPGGFIFYTNFQGRKARELQGNPNAALLFHWKSQRRQVRIEGEVSTVDDSAADAYFATRSRDSQLGAWASDQSRPLASREIFMERYRQMRERFEGCDVPRPPHWSGFCLSPRQIEFWQDREHRLHERWLFMVDSQGGWTKEMLYP